MIFIIMNISYSYNEVSVLGAKPLSSGLELWHEAQSTWLAQALTRALSEEGPCGIREELRT